MTVRVMYPGFEPFVSVVAVHRGGAPETLAANLRKAAFDLSVSVNAPDPRIWIDGSFRPDGRAEGLPADQDHKIAVSALGFIGKIISFRGNDATREELLDIKLEGVKKEGAARSRGAPPVH